MISNNSRKSDFSHYNFSDRWGKVLKEKVNSQINNIEIDFRNGGHILLRFYKQLRRKLGCLIRYQENRI